MNSTRTDKTAGGQPQQPAGLARLWPYWPAVLVGTLLLYTFALVIGTHLPNVGGIVRTPGVDKLLHFGAYFGQAMLAAAAVAATGRLGRRNAAIVMVTLAVFGGLDELTQPWFSRSAEWADWAADCLGIVLGVGLVLLLVNRLGGVCQKGNRNPKSRLLWLLAGVGDIAGRSQRSHEPLAA